MKCEFCNEEITKDHGNDKYAQLCVWCFRTILDRALRRPCNISMGLSKEYKLLMASK